ncbi:LEPR protein, partial [Campylorhamphus procurvoides]|nr:LEPR protein [Campylorhamphus procurvoides]
FIFADFLQVAAAHCMVHPVPPRNFTLPFVLLNETLLGPFSAGVESWSGLRRHHPDPSEIKPLMNENSFLCCLWSDKNIDCPLYRAGLQAREFIPSEINISASQEIGSNWTVECWMKGKLDLLVCNLWVWRLYLREDLKINLFYAVSELSLGEASTSSLQGTVRVAQCHCTGGDKYECLVPSLGLNHTYIMWLKVVAGGTPLWSPLMSLKPIDIVKPEPPQNLHLEVTKEGQVKVCWDNPVLLPYPLQYQVSISASLGHPDWQMVQTALEASVTIDSALLDSSCWVQVRCRNHQGLGFWSDWSTPHDLSLGAEVLYFPPQVLTSAGSNISFHCLYKHRGKVAEPQEVLWWLNLAEEIPASHYNLKNPRVSTVTLFNLQATQPRGSFFYNALYCCHQSRQCHPRYAELYVVDMNVNISCETDGYLSRMTCRWAAKPGMLLPGSSLQLRYYRSQIYCPDFPSPPLESEVKECHLQEDHSYQCTFQPIFLLSGYTLWIELQHPLGKLQSPPSCVIPADVVKPLPPSNVRAELTRDVGLLNVSWTDPVFANRGLKFQIRYAMTREEIPWQLSEVPKSLISWAVIQVEHLCEQYVVQVRCRELEGSGYWSDWSTPTQTLVRDIRAPLRGPEFWRMVAGDAGRRVRNVTLVWKPLRRNQSLCSVSRYIVKHQVPGSSSWLEYVDPGTSWSFPWAEHTHTITVMAMNSLGVSSVNFNLTLSQQMSTVGAVRSLSAYPVNSTCVLLLWALCPQSHLVTSLVIEWKNLNREEELKWVRVPPNTSQYYIYDHFILIEKYQFSLYPVFAGGVGKARATEQFSKGGFEEENNGSLYVVVPVVISASVLLLGALLVSHQRMKKLLWEDVPNPKNCSWAQGINFQQPETLEHLFPKHPEAMPFEPLLDSEMVLEEISVAKASENEEAPDFLGISSTFPTPQDSERDSACSSSHFTSSSSSESCHEEHIHGGIDLKYATVITSSRPEGLCQRKIHPRTCFGRCFLAEHPSVSGSSWEVGNGVFLASPGSPGRQPSKTLSLISSEGFSEPSEHEDVFMDSPERSPCYVGITPLEKRENGIFLTENSGVMGQFHTRDLLQPTPKNVHGFIQRSLKAKATVPYVPQFGMAAAKGKEVT